MALRAVLTYEDYVALPADGRWYEIHEGELSVVSPSTVQMDRGSKAQLYARHGVPHYWVVAPRGRTIDAYQLAEGSYRLAGRLEGDQPVGLPPFHHLSLDPASFWA